MDVVVDQGKISRAEWSLDIANLHVTGLLV